VSKLLIFILASSLLFASLQAQAQDEAAPAAGPDATAQFPPHTGDIGQERQRDEAERKMEREQQKKLNQERQAELKRDTDKLFQLATQLKQAVDKSSENTLSLDVIKKAGEIEKLAKSVREKMRGQN
jgi:hypothetical protein